MLFDRSNENHPVYCANCGGQMIGITLSVNPPQDCLECVACGYRMYPKEPQKKIQTISEYQRGKWDMFELITSSWGGKQIYFLGDNNIVYSRTSHQYMTIEQAYSEFLGHVGDDGEY